MNRSPSNNAPSVFGAAPDEPENEAHLTKRPAFAGFPSPAEDFAERGIDLNEILVPHKEATFFLRVRGDAMAAWGIRDRDLLIVDRSLAVKSGSIVVAVVDGRLTVRQIERRDHHCVLRASDGRAKSAQKITSERELVIWGVVCWSIHSV